MADTYVQWIPVCMGCGSRDQSKLVKSMYMWRHSRQGVGVIKVSSLLVTGFLCHDCAYNAKRKFKTVLFSLLAVGIISVVVAALASRDVLSTDISIINAIEMIMTATIVIGFGGSLGWLYLRYNMTMFFHTIKQGKIRSRLNFTFTNPMYADLFRAANPDLRVKVKGYKMNLNADDLQNIEELQNLSGSQEEEPKKVYSVGFGPTTQTIQATQSTQATQITKTCPNCNWILHSKAKFCNKCGYKFPIVDGNVEEP